MHIYRCHAPDFWLQKAPNIREESAAIDVLKKFPQTREWNKKKRKQSIGKEEGKCPGHMTRAKHPPVDMYICMQGSMHAYVENLWPL
jgi:hypothetical protein